MSWSTPGPWSVSLPDETLILGPDKSVVATTLQDDEDYFANCARRAVDADLIVRAVNSHGALLAACKLALARGRVDDSEAAMNQLAAAIALAEGPQS